MIEITTENFESSVKSSDKPVLVDFWAAWCGPCRMLAPIVEEFSLSCKDVDVGKVNVDEQPELASAYGIATIPTLILFKNGEPVNRSSGVMNAKQLETFAKA